MDKIVITIGVVAFKRERPDETARGQAVGYKG